MVRLICLVVLLTLLSCGVAFSGDNMDGYRFECHDTYFILDNMDISGLTTTAHRFETVAFVKNNILTVNIEKPTHLFIFTNDSKHSIKNSEENTKKLFSEILSCISSE